MVDVPRVVIAAPASGHGKTTVATGLLAVIEGATGFKVGPDYIDPSYHTLACGRPGRNLDPVLVGPDLIAPLFLHGAKGSQISIVEGVMGLYDGRVDGSEFGSTAHTAKLLDAPVIVVVDASAQGRSVAALLHGFRSFGDVAIAGVILNRVGSDRHEQLLRAACAEVNMPVLGALRRGAAVGVPSRHLGLVPVAERSADASRAVAAMADLVRPIVDAVVAVARTAPPMSATPWTLAGGARPSASGAAAAAAEVGKAGKVTVAVAGGAAFSFGYREQVELLEAAGAEVAVFDPLREGELPPGTRALVIGGGFPEVYATELAANVPLRRAVKRLADEGRPIAAECAGLLWLGKSLDGQEMCGVLDATATMTDRLTLGYRDAVALTPSVLADAGKKVTGHEFHRTVAAPGGGERPAWGWPGAPAEGFVQAGVHASYLHTHWAGHPDFAHRLVVAACG